MLKIMWTWRHANDCGIGLPPLRGWDVLLGTRFQGLAPLAIDYRPRLGLLEAIQKNEMLHVSHAKHCYAAPRPVG